jgi:hypothetical protein
VSVGCSGTAHLECALMEKGAHLFPRHQRQQDLRLDGQACSASSSWGTASSSE